MLLGKNQVKQTAVLLSLVYLFLSSHMMIGGAGHALEHMRRTNSRPRHASFVCSWTCAASTSVQSANPSLSEKLNPTFEELIVSDKPSYDRLSIFYFQGRSPPGLFA
jgi:hypothetical protein